ncbi:PAAR domain-containing protein [Pseudomonas sp. NPDC078700]|uniref:PAAR domain-containing protein n=1 Tax=Pseudomonas sp. NPDC078700 TaxID=3364424 RepID=UPI0037C69923
MIPTARLGDLHDCPIAGHGKTPIVSASPDDQINFLGAARVGDKCGCGAVITTGFPSIVVNNRPLAYVGSRSSHGGTIVSGSPDTFGGFGGASSDIVDFAQLGTIRSDGSVDDARMTTLLKNPNLMQQALVEEPSPVDASSALVEPMAKAQPQDPGFYIVPQSTTVQGLESQLFTSPSAAVLNKFKTLNPNLGQVKAGHMIVLSDPNNQQCTREEALLMEAASKVNASLESLTPDEADFMARNRDEIESFLTQGSTSIGIGEAIFAKHLDAVSNSLHSIDSLHQRSFQQYGHLRSPEFFAERQRLFSQLEMQLTSLTKKGIGFPDHPDLKSALGISSRSLVHHWTKAGAPSQIPGYATHINGVARAAKYIKVGGWIGTTVGAGASYMKVKDVCTAGNTEACERIRLTETGAFAGTVGGGAIAGLMLTGSTVASMCVALGVPTGGLATLACGIVVIGAGSFAAGALGATAGEAVAEKIYEVAQ